MIDPRMRVGTFAYSQYTKPTLHKIDCIFGQFYPIVGADD